VQIARDGHYSQSALLRLKEEVKLINFLFYGLLIKGLGAELLASKDQRKFSKFKQPLKFLISA
jgi:hypothetical protein